MNTRSLARCGRVYISAGARGGRLRAAIGEEIEKIGDGGGGEEGKLGNGNRDWRFGGREKRAWVCREGLISGVGERHSRELSGIDYKRNAF